MPHCRHNISITSTQRFLFTVSPLSNHFITVSSRSLYSAKYVTIHSNVQWARFFFFLLWHIPKNVLSSEFESQGIIEPSEFILPAIIAKMEPALPASRLLKKVRKALEIHPWCKILTQSKRKREREKNKSSICKPIWKVNIAPSWPPFGHFNTPEMNFKYLNYTLPWKKVGWEKTRCLLPV